MLIEITSYASLDTRKLMDLYAESNIENVDYFYPNMADKSAALALVEEGFLKCGFQIVSNEGFYYLQTEVDHYCYGMEYRFIH